MKVLCALCLVLLGTASPSWAIDQPEAPPQERIAPKRVIIDESIVVDRRTQEDLIPSNLEFKRQVREQAGRDHRMRQDFKAEDRLSNPVKPAPLVQPIRTLDEAKSAGIDPLRESKENSISQVSANGKETAFSLTDEMSLYLLAGFVLIAVFFLYRKFAK